VEVAPRVEPGRFEDFYRNNEVAAAALVALRDAVVRGRRAHETAREALRRAAAVPRPELEDAAHLPRPRQRRQRGGEGRAVDDLADALRAANNYAWGLLALERFEEVKALMRKTIPVARRVLNEDNDLMLVMPWACANALYKDDDATLDDLREAVTTLEDVERTARRVKGGAHPDVLAIVHDLQQARAVLGARETPPTG